MLYNDELRQKHPVLAKMSDETWNRVFQGKQVLDHVNENIIQMIEEKKFIEGIFSPTIFSITDIWLAIRDYHQLSSQEWYELADSFSVPDFWQERIAVITGDLDYLNTYFFNDRQAFKKRFEEYDYQILISAAEYNHFTIVNRLLEIYPDDLQKVFRKRGADILQKAIEFGHVKLVEHYLKIYPEGRLLAFLNALLINQEEIFQQFNHDEINEWIKTAGEKVFKNAYLSGNVRLFDKLIASFSPEKIAELIEKNAFDALFRSVLSEHLDMLVKIDSLLTDELRTKILHEYSRKDLFQSAVQTGNIEICHWIRSIKIHANDVFLGMNCMESAQFQRNLPMVDFLIEYAEAYGVLNDFLSAWSLEMATYYGDIDIFEHIISKVEPQDFVNFIQKGAFADIFYSALTRGYEEIADRIEHYAKQYGCWEDIKEQKIFVDCKKLMRQSPHLVQRFLEITNHLEEIDYREIASFLSTKLQAFIQNPPLFLSHYPQQIDAVIQYAIQTNQTIPLDLLQAIDVEKYEKTWIDKALEANHEDFILSYLKLPGMFDKVYGGEQAKLKDYLIKAQVDECFTPKERMEIENTLHQALKTIGIGYDIRLVDKPILSLELSIRFKNAFELELFKTYLGIPEPEYKQFPCEQTIDIYRKHGQINIERLPENLNRIQAHLGFGNTDPGMMLIKAIGASMHSVEHSTISAYIKTTANRQNYFCLSVKNLNPRIDEQELLDNLLKLFPALCEKNGIEKIKSDWISERSHVASHSDYYEFNIQADDFHALMLKESNDYRGYRSSIYSVYQLAHPETQYYKPETMCLFPIQALENAMMIRNAGCNISEVLSVQLSTLIQHSLEKYKSVSIGGHHQSKILDQFGLESRQLISTALLCAGASSEYIETHDYHEAFDGFNIIPLTEEHQQFVKEMDASTLPIYGVSANLSCELSALKSFEVPMKTYLSTLIMVCQAKSQLVEELQELINKMQVSKGSNVVHP
jgi:hypothetical protein